MLAVTVLWLRSVLRFSFTCNLRPHAKVNPRTPLTLFFPLGRLICLDPLGTVIFVGTFRKETIKGFENK